MELLQCLLRNSDPSVPDPIANPHPAGMGNKETSPKTLESSTMWYIKIVVTKFFEGKAHHLFYWLKPTSPRKKTPPPNNLLKTHTYIHLLICVCKLLWIEIHNTEAYNNWKHPGVS